MIKFTYIDIIGLIAGILLIISLIPQLIKIISSKSSKDVSIFMFIILLVSEILWLIYGVFKIDLQLIITNGITSIITLLIIILSWMYNKNN
jgi:MtN3 and saliva related transmembrane protein